MCTNCVVWLRSAATLVGVLLAISIAAQDQTATIELKPSNPTDKDDIVFTLSGVWRNGCVPRSPQVSVASGVIRIETSNPDQVCTQALTPWSLSGSLGVLAAGDYLLTITYSSAGLLQPIEIGRKSFTVIPSTATSELIFPIVVNGAVGEKAHYQTIFTVLNGNAQDVHATLEIYSNSGAPAGVFCSPLAPPPAIVTATLNPGAELLRFTSADLPFLNGWARFRSDDGEGILAGAELTLVAAAPDRCLLVCNRPSNEKLSSAQIPAVRPSREFRFPLTLNRNRQTALAVVNPTSEAVTVGVTVLDGSGSNASFGVPNRFDVKIGPQQRISKFVWEMVLESAPTLVPVPFPDGFQGSVIVASMTPIAVGALNIMFPEGKFVSVPTLSR
jgi:hypothetical protein